MPKSKNWVCSANTFIYTLVNMRICFWLFQVDPIDPGMVCATRARKNANIAPVVREYKKIK